MIFDLCRFSAGGETNYGEGLSSVAIFDTSDSSPGKIRIEIIPFCRPQSSSGISCITFFLFLRLDSINNNDVLATVCSVDRGRIDE